MIALNRCDNDDIICHDRARRMLSVAHALRLKAASDLETAVSRWPAGHLAWIYHTSISMLFGKAFTVLSTMVEVT